MIWDTTVELATRTEEQVILLTADKDFSDSSGQLHPDLLRDLTERELPDDRVILVRSLGEFVDKYVRPTLEVSLPEGLPQQFIELNVEARETIAESVREEFSGVEWSSYELGLPPEFETLYLDVVESMTDLEVADAEVLPDNQIRATLEGTLDCLFDVFMYKPDWVILDDDRFILYDSDWNDHYVWGVINLDLRCRIDIQVDLSDPQQQKIDVLNVQLEFLE